MLALVVFVWWAATQGASTPTQSFPGTALVLGALLVLLVARPDRLASTSRLVRVALGSGVLLGGLALLSTVWADAPGDAWDGANRALLYVACFALFGLTSFRAGSLATLVALFAAGIAAVGMVTLARAAEGVDPGRIFVDNRLSQPIGYVNASCALFLMAFLPAAVLASRRDLPVAARGFLFGVAFCLVELAVLCQSRASLVALPVTLVIAFSLCRQRVRLLVTLALIAAVSLLTLDRLLAVYKAVGVDDERHAVGEALRAIGIGWFAIVLAGLGFAWADRRLHVPERAARRAERAFGFAAAATTVLLVVVALVALGNPVGRAQAAWDEFNSGYPETFEGSHFTGGLGDYRADYWRVALGQFRDAPLLGVGADNFAAAYVEERRFDNEARFPHSTPVAILSSHGLVGTALFVSLISCALVAFARRRRSTPTEMPVAAASLLVFAYWAVHGSVDWFWELPGLAAPAFAFLGAAAGISRERVGAAPPGRGGRPLTVVAVLVVIAALLAATPPWLSARHTQSAVGAWTRNPDASLDGLDVASRLNPLSSHPDLLAGAIANRTDREERAREVLLRAVSRNPVNWYAYFELAVAQAGLGRREEALATIERAAELNPREELIRRLGGWVTTGAQIELGEIDAVLRERVASRTGADASEIRSSQRANSDYRERRQSDGD